ncbi:Zinc finger BED domain-containing protein RICESLEEPER 2 [Bienertia sinuspersici]
MEKSIDPIPIDLAESDGERVQDSHPVKASTKKSSKKISNLTNLTKPGSHFKRQRRLTSEVWVNYEFLDEPDENGNLLCKCKKCGTTYNADSKNGTGNLKRHIQNCKRRNYLDVGQMIIDSSASGSLQNRLPSINADIFRELVASAIVRHDLPFQFAEYDGIRKCFSYLHPDVKVVSRNTLKADILKMYRREKSNLREYMTAISSRISLTSDCWSSITTDGYISLTAHFIDDHWTLQKRILNFRFLPPPHSGVHMSDEVCSMLKEWGIQKKIMSITLDNASSNDVFADVIKSELDLICGGNYFHVRCCAHILNLVVQDGLKEIDDAVIKVRESVKYCKGSQARRQRFLTSVAHVELDNARGLRQDVPTRWNSTYLMLESVLYYKKAFIHFQKSDANYIHCPTTDEWVRIEKIFRFLKVFYDVTKVFSGTLYHTANMYFPNVLKVRLLLKEEMGSTDKFMNKMANKMYEKFSKYWANFSTIMAVAVVLDPRFKFQFVEWAYKRVYGEFEYESELSKFKDKFNALYDAYYHEFAIVPSTSHSHTSNNKSGQHGVVDVDPVCDEFMTVNFLYCSILLFYFNFSNLQLQ